MKWNQTKNAPVIDIYQNNKICVLGCGSSLEQYDINYENYDVVVSFNRIYNNQKYLKHVNVIYNCLSYQDRNNFDKMISTLSQQKKLQYLIMCPWWLPKCVKVDTYRILCKYNFLNYVYSNDIVRNPAVIKTVNGIPLSGIAAIYHICTHNPKNIDIYGFDFYTSGYIENIKSYPNYFPSRNHDIESNKNFLNDLISKYQNINWYQ
jgi:hypothetical protein